jgi:hypothetical protein
VLVGELPEFLTRLDQMRFDICFLCSIHLLAYLQVELPCRAWFVSSVGSFTSVLEVASDLSIRRLALTVT